MNNKSISFSPRAFHQLVRQLIKHGKKVAPRGIPTSEIVNGTLVVKNPIDRVVTDRGRRMNIAFGFAEWYAIMFGYDNIDFFKRFIADYGKYSSDNEHLDGAYGTRFLYHPIAVNEDGSTVVCDRANQIDFVINKLKTDQDSRQAVISIYDSDDLTIGRGGINTPCTLALQFMIRDSQLDMIVTMRSSDIVKGVTYDLFVFTLIQEYIARQLNVRLGTYFHNAGSLHFYESDKPMVEKFTMKRWPFLMDAMPRLNSEDLDRFHSLIRDGSGLDDLDFFEKAENHFSDMGPASGYLYDIAMCMKAYNDRKMHPDLSAKAYGNIVNGTIKYVLRPFLVSTGALKDRGRHDKAASAT